MAKKWTKAEREAASIVGKKRWAARRLRAIRTDAVESDNGVRLRSIPHPTLAEGLATDVVRLIAHDVPADVIVKVVERILRP